MALEPFQRVLDTHADTVLRYLRATLGVHDAEDAFQETFLAALRAYPQLRGRANVRAWLLTIARHKAIDAHRARQRRPVPVESLPERAAPGAEEARGGFGLIADLKAPRAREVLFLRYVADLTHREIAAVLGCTEGASRRAAADGLAALRRDLTHPPSPAEGPTTRP